MGKLYIHMSLVLVEVSIYDKYIEIEIEIEIVFIILKSTQNFSKRESRYRT